MPIPSEAKTVLCYMLINASFWQPPVLELDSIQHVQVKDFRCLACSRIFADLMSANGFYQPFCMAKCSRNGMQEWMPQPR